GAVAQETLEFGGDMAHKTLTLTFDEVGAAVAAFPNPTTEGTNVSFALSVVADVVVVMRDVQGREVMAVNHAGLAAGQHTLPLALESLQAGTYTLDVIASGVPLGSTRLVVLE
ncbi:MAG: T9SS type A sorting domain-containing protein, partial [Bacteroidetes bacterium]|nr:T9SS type A sorting domain-containing protein [Bacteroidota bacterium]